MDGQSITSGQGKKIAVMGVCTSGKSTLVNNLRQRGYDAFSVPQEHSYIARLWKAHNPDFLVVLDCSYPTAASRRKVSWGPERLLHQRERLKMAIAECDLYIPTDDYSPEEVTEMVMRAVEHHD